MQSTDQQRHYILIHPTSINLEYNALGTCARTCYVVAERSRRQQLGVLSAFIPMLAIANTIVGNDASCLVRIERIPLEVK